MPLLHGLSLICVYIISVNPPDEIRINENYDFNFVLLCGVFCLSLEFEESPIKQSIGSKKNISIREQNITLVNF